MTEDGNGCEVWRATISKATLHHQCGGLAETRVSGTDRAYPASLRNQQCNTTTTTVFYFPRIGWIAESFVATRKRRQLRRERKRTGNAEFGVE